jgi:hypothetical protein
MKLQPAKLIFMPTSTLTTHVVEVGSCRAIKIPTAFATRPLGYGRVGEFIGDGLKT